MLVTDVGGYDLPEPNGPYQAIQLTSKMNWSRFGH